MRVFAPGEDRVRDDDEIIDGLDNPVLRRALRRRTTSRRADEIELVREAAPALRRGRSSWPATRRRCSSARRSTTSACARCSTRWSTWRRRRAPRAAMQRVVQPDEPKFSGVVFKIQANMDPAHRDRIAFVRVACGPLRARHAAEGGALGQGAAAQHRGVASCRSGASCSTRPSPATSSASPTTACCSSATRSPRARRCSSPACRSSRRRCSARVEVADPLRTKQLRAGLTQLGEEGAIQVFRPVAGTRAAARRGRAAAVRGGGAPAGARVRRARRASCRPLPRGALGDLRRGRRRRARAQALHRRQRAPRGLRRGRRADACWSNTRRELRAIAGATGRRSGSTRCASTPGWCSRGSWTAAERAAGIRRMPAHRQLAPGAVPRPDPLGPPGRLAAAAVADAERAVDRRRRLPGLAPAGGVRARHDPDAQRRLLRQRRRRPRVRPPRQAHRAAAGDARRGLGARGAGARRACWRCWPSRWC